MMAKMQAAIANAGVELRASAGSRPFEPSGLSLGTVLRVLGTGVCYYLATRAAWVLCFPDSKVSLSFPPHAILVAILLLVPTRHWWAYTLAAAGSHFVATQQAGWPPLYALQCEAFDAVKFLLAAAGIRLLIKSRFHLISLREAVLFVLIAVVVVPFGTAFWGAAFTVSNRYGANYWIEWRNLGISNAVTAIVLVPVILMGANKLVTRRFRAARGRILEAGLLALGLLAIGVVAFNRMPAGPDTSAALLYAPVPLLIWAALRFGLGGVSTPMQGRGPFLAQTPAENALALQLFLLMVATPLMLLTVAIDDEKRSKEALRVSEERMSLAVESAQLVLWDWDIANDKVWITDEGRKVFGFEPGEQINFSELEGRVHPDDSGIRARAIEQALVNSGSFEAEYRVIHPDGTVRWIAGRGRASSTAQDAPPRILGVSMDVTRQRQAGVEAQAQREELAYLSRVATVSALSGSLAHELSQPLGSILINAQSGLHVAAQDEPDIEELRAILADIVSADRRAVEIIERLRTMLRRGEVALQPVRVGESVDELLRLTRSDLIARGVSVSNLIGDDLPRAMTDLVQLQLVLLNLIVNACDAMKSNRPEDRSITVMAFVAGKELRIGVLDCGMGLPDDIETLFQAFHSTKEGGLGMGLSICRTLVTSHGGRLWGERRAERGAAFYVALPLAPQPG
jgi:signal transduction histidine kinase/integral membrane sensor domain MASE1